MLMSRWLAFRALAQRAATTWGTAGRQAIAAKRMRAEFYRVVWHEAAEFLCADVTQLDDNVLQIERGAAITRVSLNYTELDDPVTLQIAGRKPLVTKLLAANGLPTLDSVSFDLSELRKAELFLQAHGVCVVKPASGTGGGQGVTTGIRTPRQLRTAAVNAAGFGSRILIEKQLAGMNLRLLMLDGELLDAVERQPPSVVGDGRTTIRRLLEQLNRRRLDTGHSMAQSMVRIDGDLRHCLASQGMSLGTVPAEGCVIRLKCVINDNSAEDNVPARDRLHPDLIAAARSAAAAVGLRLAGVDIITSDPSLSLAEAGGVILEVNSTPGFHCHYARRSDRELIAVPILAACLDTANARSRGNGARTADTFSNAERFEELTR